MLLLDCIYVCRYRYRSNVDMIDTSMFFSWSNIDMDMYVYWSTAIFTISNIDRYNLYT